MLTYFKCSSGRIEHVAEFRPELIREGAEALHWIDLEDPTVKEATILEDPFHFHPLAIEELIRAAQAGVPPEGAALPVTLSLASGDDSLKLVRGFYVVAPLFENDSEPSWSGYGLNKVDGRWALTADAPERMEQTVRVIHPLGGAEAAHVE